MTSSGIKPKALSKSCSNVIQVRKTHAYRGTTTYTVVYSNVSYLTVRPMLAQMSHCQDKAEKSF